MDISELVRPVPALNEVPIFPIGDRVRVARRSPIGHYRVPTYPLGSEGARSDKAETGPFALGAWLVAAIIATPTTSFANPAVVIGALVSSGPLHLGSGAVAPFVLA